MKWAGILWASAIPSKASLKTGIENSQCVQIKKHVQNDIFSTRDDPTKLLRIQQMGQQQ